MGLGRINFFAHQFLVYNTSPNRHPHNDTQYIHNEPFSPFQASSLGRKFLLLRLITRTTYLLFCLKPLSTGPVFDKVN